MELRLLKYFFTIADKGSVSKAAESLNITQPTLSRQLRDLEEELGEQLFVRTKNQMVLTEAGYFLKNRAETILELSQQMEKEFQDRRNQLFSGNVTIGCVEADNSDTLSMILEEFTSDYPEVTFHIFSGTSDEIVEKLEQGLIDLAILLEPISLMRFEILPLPRVERWGLLVSRKSFLSKKSVIEPEDIMGIPLLISRRQEIQDMLVAWSKLPFQSLNIVGSYNLIFNVFSLVENKVGSAVTIEGAIANHKMDQLKFIPLFPGIQTNCVLAWRKNRVLSPITEELIYRFKELNK